MQRSLFHDKFGWSNNLFLSLPPSHMPPIHTYTHTYTPTNTHTNDVKVALVGTFYHRNSFEWKSFCLTALIKQICLTVDSGKVRVLVERGSGRGEGREGWGEEEVKKEVEDKRRKSGWERKG